MKTLLTIALLFTIAFAVQAQDIKTAEGFFKSKEFNKAKTAIDEAVSGAYKTDPKAWAWKHKIYQAIGLAAEPAEATTLLLAGFEALKKGTAMPQGEDAALLVLGLEVTSGFNNYYTAFINNASALMNENNFNSAFDNFKNGITVSSYLYEKKLIPTQLDTMLNFYAGYTAMKANKINETVFYFKKLADADAYSTDLQIAYGWLANYYLADKKDAATAKLYCDKGLKLYPGDAYLADQRVKLQRASGNTDALFKTYEDVIKSGKAIFSDYLAYGAELYDYLYLDDKPKTDKNAREQRMFEILNKGWELKSSSAEINYILGMSYTGKALELDGEVKKTTITTAEKDRLKKERDDAIQKSTVFLEAASVAFLKKTSMNANDKEHYKASLQQLVNLYKFTADKTKQTATEEKLKAL